MNESHAEGAFDKLKGKVEQAFGEATNDQSAANKGAADQVKGSAKETWGDVKDTAHHVTTSNTNTAKTETAETSHNFRDDVTNAAEHAKESIQHGLDNLRNKSNS